jgi:hypothetical protein
MTHSRRRGRGRSSYCVDWDIELILFFICLNHMYLVCGRHLDVRFYFSSLKVSVLGRTMFWSYGSSNSRDKSHKAIFR